ncbi:MAG: two-component regulator propeller domain-containing protein, partial [Bacteroidota bacterium]
MLRGRFTFRTKAVYFFLFLQFVLLSQLLAQENKAFKKLGMQDGLSHTTVYSIYQDHLGAVWFGTRQGLNRYNGDYIEKIPIDPVPDDMSNHIIWHIEGDNQGHLFFLVDRCLMQYSLKNGEFSRLVESTVDDFTFHGGKIWYVNWEQLGVINPNEPGKGSEIVKQFDIDESGYGPVIQGDQDCIWLGMQKGLCCLDTSGVEKFEVLPDKKVTALLKGNAGSLWVGTQGSGLYKLRKSGEIEEHFGFTRDDIRSLEQDDEGNILVGTFHGLTELDPATKTVNRFRHLDKQPFSLSHSSIYSLMKDKQGTIWIGTYYGGVNYYNPQKDVFQIYRSNDFYDNQLSFPIVGTMAEDNEGDLWVATEGGGLNKVDREQGTIQSFRAETGKNSIPRDNLKSVWYDSISNRLYIGTHQGGLSVLDIDSGKFNNYNSEASAAKTLPNDVVNKIVPYKDGLFLITQGGIPLLDVSTGKLSRKFWEQHPELPETSVADIFVDSSGRMWMSFFGWGIVMYDTQSGELTDYRNRPSGPASLPHFRVVDIFEDSENRVFFTTEGAGVLQYDEKNDQFKRFTASQDSLLSDFCLNLAESPDGELVITSYEGITFFDLESGESQYYTIHDNLPLSGIIEENGLFVASDGEIFVGGIDGMVSFRKEELSVLETEYNIYLSKLQINNKLIRAHDESGVLEKELAFTSSIVLNHKQNNVDIEFSTSNYVRYAHREYEYKLEGFNKKWVPTEGFNITYTNLSPGDYRLMIREKGTEKDLSEMAVLDIRVKPPYYATTLAYVLYVFLLLSLVTGIILFNRSKALLRASLEIERKEKQQIKMLNQAKVRFFTNVSHEFRTPLTLIINHARLIEGLKGLPTSAQTQVEKIKKHTTRLRHMINEILDFRKQEQGELKLNVEWVDLIDFLKEIFGAFKDYAQNMQIEFRLDHPDEVIGTWLDPAQMQKVFYNLLSNAFRFTSAGDLIVMEVAKKSQSVIIKVRDTGKGIEQDELHKIFDRYYQAENFTSYQAGNMSTGIGLALSKGIVELHHGTLEVESTPGEGSVFKIELLLGDEHFSNDQKSGSYTRDTQIIEELSTRLETEETSGEKISNTGELPQVLIVEDNEDLLALLKELFEPLYRVELATNGEDGLQKAKEIVPDLVISDVMMSRMSGTVLCQKIKSSYNLSHIPVILLTALDDYGEMIHGLKVGADDYILKPFDSDHLIARCNNLISTRKTLKEKYSGYEQPGEVVLAQDSSDKEFIENIHKVIQDNLMNTLFSVDDLARETGMGRSKLYARVKEVTGYTPNEYIMNYKLKRAMTLLKERKNLSVSEVAFQLGFSSARYFSLCFKDHYGIPPSSVKKG